MDYKPSEFQKLTHNEILIKLGRYPISEKLNILQKHSCALISEGGLNIHRKNIIFPWELDTFLLLAINSNNNHTPLDFASKQGSKDFVNIINSIKHGLDPFKSESENVVGEILTLIGMQQFPFQEDTFIKIYRYSFIFDETSIKEAFIKKFGCSYGELADFAYFIYFLMKYNHEFHDAITYKLNTTPNLTKTFAINIDELRTRQEKLTPDSIDYKFGLKLSQAYPIIESDGVYYLPLPHNFCYAATDSISHRLTSEGVERNSKLRNALGRAFELYVLHMLEISKRHSGDEIVSAFKYKKTKSRELDTSDAIVHEQGSLLFFEAKLMSVPVQVMNLDIDERKKITKRIAESIIQVYNRMNDYPKFYNPFPGVSVEKEERFGIVVALYDPYILRDEIYAEVAEQLSQESDSLEMAYIRSNIVFCKIFDLEILYYYRSGVLDVLRKRRLNEVEWTNMTLLTESPPGKLIDSVNKHIGQFLGKIQDEFVELKKKGIMKFG